MPLASADIHYGLGRYPRCRDCVEWYPATSLSVSRIRNPLGTTTVYLFFGRQPWESVSRDTLLYVGISDQPVGRWESHRSQKPWWGDVERIQQRFSPSREDALQHERHLIAACDPVYNRTGVHHERRELGRQRYEDRLRFVVADLARGWALPA